MTETNPALSLSEVLVLLTIREMNDRKMVASDAAILSTLDMTSLVTGVELKCPEVLNPEAINNACMRLDALGYVTEKGQEGWSGARDAGRKQRHASHPYRGGIQALRGSDSLQRRSDGESRSATVRGSLYAGALPNGGAVGGLVQRRRGLLGDGATETARIPDGRRARQSHSGDDERDLGLQPAQIKRRRIDGERRHGCRLSLSARVISGERK